MSDLNTLNVTPSTLSVERSASAADADNPWPGLDSFTESSREFFHGRSEEVAELSRRVQRKLLTVLFGQSGLGKTSILRAGVVPRLRDQGYCPVYLRIDYSAEAPPPGEQIKTAVVAATSAVGQWTRPGVARSGETLWEFLHHREDALQDATGTPVIPLLIFDQFEEIFTLAQANDAARARAAGFQEELADLVENRPPRSVEARLESDEGVLEQFDFGRADYRVIVSLREDYLPHLEMLKGRMPSMTQNRMRLAQMKGTQALEAVIKPGGALVNEDVARAIVEFVAGAKGGSIERLAELEVEPPLLSVICRELNERRKAQGQAQISADLVSGNRREILNDFYERSVSDLPEAMRSFVEDRLLTKSGFRDNLALETALEEPGVTRDRIDTLVSRRLLRIEDRLGVQRVELTHDVLAEVIRGSRDTRQQRLALAKERARERATHRRMWFARSIAAALLVGLAGVSWVAWRAVRAERLAQQLRFEADDRRREEGRRWGRSNLEVATRLLDEGKGQDGLAYLAHAATVDPENPTVGLRIITALVGRSFPQPTLTATKLPARTRSFQRGPDGTFAAVGVDGVVRILDPNTLNILRTFPVPEFGSIWIGGDSVWVRLPASIAQWDYRTGAQVGEIPLRATETGFVVARSGKTWVTRDANKAFFRDGTNGRVLTEVTLPWDLTWGAINDQGTVAFLGSSTKGRLWSILDGHPLGPELSWEGLDDPKFSPDGTMLALPVRGEIELWDIGADAPRSAFKHSGQISECQFSKDGTKLITGGTERTVKVWDIATGLQIVPPLPHSATLWAADPSSDGRWLWTRCSDLSIRRWSMEDGSLVTEPLRLRTGDFPAATEDGSATIVVSREGDITRYSLRPAGAQPLSIGDPGSLGTAWKSDVSASLVEYSATGVRLIDVTAPNRVTEIFTFPHPISAGVLAPTNRAAVVRTRSGEVQVWHLVNEGAKTFPLQDPPSSDVPRIIDPLGEFAAGVSETTTRRLRLWDLRTGKLHGELLEFARPIYGPSITFSADGRYVAATDRREAKIWETATNRLVHTLALSERRTDEIRFSPDSQRLATGAGSFGQIWDAQSGKPIGPPLAHPTNFVYVGQFSPDSRRLVTWHTSVGLARVWDAESGSPVGAIMEHPDRIQEPVFSPDSRTLASVSADATVRLWDTETGRLLAEPLRSGNYGSRLSFSPDGKFIALFGSDRKTYIWAVPPRVKPGAPEWLIELATAYSGKHVGDSGVLSEADLASDALERLRGKITALPANDPFAAWAQWFLANPETRPFAPGFNR